MRRNLIRVLAALACMAASAAQADYYVVVSERNPVESLSQDQVLQLFMGRTRFYPDGRPVVAYDIDNDALRAGFYKSLSGMSLPQVNSYWARLMFSGRNLPPQRMDDAGELISRVLNNPAAIGWLREAPKQKGLRTVLVIREQP